jgi:DNA-directed RNA polymerase specialized sigma24 family protein
MGGEVGVRVTVEPATEAVDLDRAMLSVNLGNVRSYLSELSTETCVYRRLHRFFWRRIRNHEAAEDLRAETLMRRVRYGPMGPVEDEWAYLMGIAVNVLADYYRENVIKAEHEMSLDEIMEATGNDDLPLTEDAETLERLVSENREALERLANKHREALQRLERERRV